MTRALFILVLVCCFGCTHNDTSGPAKTTQDKAPLVIKPLQKAVPTTPVATKASTSKASLKPNRPFSVKVCFEACNQRRDGSKDACLRRCKTSAMLRSSKPKMDINTCRLRCDDKQGSERHTCLRNCNPASQDVPKTKRYLKVSEIARKFCTVKCAKTDPALQKQCIEKCTDKNKKASKTVK